MHTFHGAIPLNPIHRKARKLYHRAIGKRLVKGVPFDWVKGYHILDVVGTPKIKNQDPNSSCSGQSSSYFLWIQRQLQGIREGELSAKSFYAPIAYKGGGTTVVRLQNQLEASGINLETSVPSYDVYGNPLSEMLMEDKSWQTSELSTDAFQRAGYTLYDIGEDIDEVAATIRDWGGVIWEICGQDNGTWTSAYPKPPSKNNPNELWYHFMCAVGAKLIDGKKTIIALQSYGELWGDHGIQYFQEDYFNSGYIIDCFTFIHDDHIKPLPTNVSWMAQLLRYFRSLWGLSNAIA